MGGNGVSTSYTYSTQTDLPNPSRVWFVIDPGGVTNTTGSYPPSNTGSLTLKIYVQTNKPTSADTPWHTEAVSGSSFDTIGIIARGTTMYWDRLEWTLEDYWAFRSADSGFKWAPTQHETGVNESPVNTNFVPTGVPYLGTDKIYEVGETT
jgi:hypothetical protein